jgi:hypothetical protein
MHAGSEAVVRRFPDVSMREIGRRRRSDSFAHWCERHASGVVFALTAMVAAIVSAALVLELWRSELRIPFAYSSDALFVEAVTKNLEHGWYYTNASLAAPLGQELYDFPIGNSLNMALLKLLVVGFSNPVVALNVFFLCTFPLTALAAFLVMRSLRISPGVAAACSVLFALLPYHFRRGEAHAFLSAYYAVPLIAYLLLGVLGSCRLFARPNDLAGPWRRLLARRNVMTLVLCVVVGASSPYYALAAVIFLAVAAVIAGVAHHSIRSALPGLALAAVVLCTLIASAAPAISYRLHHGANPVAGKRSAFETELYGLKISDLVLPLDNHRLKPLARMKATYDSTSPVSSEGGQTLGFIGTFGLLALLGGGIVLVVRGSWRIGGAAFPRAGAATVIVLVFATTAGFSSVVSYTLTPQLHAWNRLSVLVGFFALLAVAFLFDALWWRWRSTGLRKIFPILLVVAVVVGILDQTSSAFVPPYKAIQRSFKSDGRFVAAVERRLPRGASVYQLPYVPFPESETAEANDYGQLRGYLHSSDLRWSYGAMKGRQTDWNAIVSTLPLRFVLPAVTAIGFDGVSVNRSGYPGDAKALVADLAHRLRQRPLSSSDREFLFFDLRPLRTLLERRYSQSELAALRVAALHPVTIQWSNSFWPEERSGAKSWRWSKRPDAYITLVNPTKVSRRVTFRFVLGAGLKRTSNAIVFYPDGASQLVTVTPTGVPVERTFAMPPGAHFLRVSSDAAKITTVPGDPRPALYLRVANTSLMDSAFRVLDPAGGAEADSR